MKLLIRLGINVFALIVVAELIPGFTFVGLWDAVITAVVIGVMNTFLKPVLQIIALPITIITFGIAAFLINVALLWLTSMIVPGFEIATFMTAVIASILLALISWFLHTLATD